MSKPGALSFTGTMDDLVLNSSAPKLRVVVKVSTTDGVRNVLDEIYFPDDNNSVTIYRPGDLCEPYARQYGSVTAVATVNELDDDENITATMDVDLGTVLFANVDPQISAEEFCATHFLTILNGPKETAVGRKECLSAYDAETVTVSAVVMDSERNINTVGGTLSPINTTGKVYDYDVSPLNIGDLLALSNDQILVQYTIQAGKRKQQYKVRIDKVMPAPSLAFLNSFGCWEYIHCTGTHKKSSKFTYSTAVIGNNTRNYDIQEQRQLTANTGSLNYAMAEWADELFRSEKVYLYTGGKMGKEIIVSDVKDEVTNEDDNMPAYEFTWMYAQKLHNVIDTETKRIRVFDNTFDYTFE